MLTITVWQPHATLLMLGVKPFETRSKRAPASLIGQRVGIHAGLRLDDLRELAEYIEARNDGAPRIASFDAMANALNDAGFNRVGDLPRGHLLGSILVRESVPTVDLTCDPGHFGDFRPGRHAWRVEQPALLRQPVPFKGSQGFFHVPDNLFLNPIAEMADAYQEELK